MDKYKKYLILAFICMLISVSSAIGLYINIDKMTLVMLLVLSGFGEIILGTFSILERF